jgi:hypothetical protein
MNHVIEGHGATAPVPTRSGLAKQLAMSITAAGVILTLFILPSEYGIDPTGLGARMGLLALSAPSPAAVPDIPMAPPETARFYNAAVRSNVIEIPLKGDEDLEYKVRMKAGETLTYSWSVDNGKAYYDFHGESEPDKATVRYREEQDGATGGHGALVAPFDGIHGWYWLNLEERPIVITLRVGGFYELRPQQEQPIGSVIE